MVDRVNMVMFCTTNNYPSILTFFDLKMCIGYGIEFVVSFIFIQIHVSSLLLNLYKDT